jgi:hypothetical protein
MILGMSTATFTLLHVLISLIGIASGLVVVIGMLSSKRLPGWTAVFLTTTVLTSVTGFLFHSASFGPPHVVGIISLLVLAPTIVALYLRGLAGAWRWIYIVGAVMALYLNAFVGVVQAFGKIAFLHALAPNGNELPFVIAQAAVLAAFVWLGFVALRRFRFAANAPTFAHARRTR